MHFNQWVASLYLILPPNVSLLMFLLPFKKSMSDCKVLSLFVGYVSSRDVTVQLLPNYFIFFFISKEVKLSPVDLFQFLCCLQAGAPRKLSAIRGSFCWLMSLTSLEWSLLVLRYVLPYCMLLNHIETCSKEKEVMKMYVYSIYSWGCVFSIYIYRKVHRQCSVCVCIYIIYICIYSMLDRLIP